QDLEDTFHTASATQREGQLQAARESEARFQKLDHDRLEEAQDQKRRFDSAFEESKNDYNRRMELAKNAYERATDRQERDLLASRSDHSDQLRQAHEKETADLRRQMSELVTA